MPGEDLRIPLPVVVLLRRSLNAKSPRDRHDNAYFAWEVSAKLLAASHLAADPRPIATGAVGDWVKAARSEEGAQLRSPEVLEAYAHLRRAALGEDSTAQSISAARLLDLLPSYRNQYVGHTTVLRDQGFYDAGADKLAAGLMAAWANAAFLREHERLVWVESVERTAEGTARPRVLDLTGEGPRLLSPEQASHFADALPSRVHVWDEETSHARSLHPLVMFDDESDRTYLFNGTSRRAEYLDFAGGKRLVGKPLDERFPGLAAAVFAAFRAERAPAATAAAAAADEPGVADAQRFGDFRVLGKLGEGGMGEVYLAVQETLDRVVALKVIRTAKADDPVARARFQREVRALSRCDHRNVVKILTSGSERGSLWYAMEHVEGADLGRIAESLMSSGDLDTAVSSAMAGVAAERAARFPDAPAIEKSRPPSARGDKVQQLAEAMRDASRGVAHLHERGILHRDLKPGNLMVTPDRRVVVMDLGLATLKETTRSVTEQDAARLLGTLRYMAPEQLAVRVAQVDERADVFGLGACFYEMLTERPFRRAKTAEALAREVSGVDPEPVRKANRSVPRDLAAILHKCAFRETHLRYSTAAALANDLDAYLDDRPITAREPSFAYYAGLAIRRNRALAGSLAALLLILVGGLWVSLALYGDARRAEGDAKTHAAAATTSAQVAQAASRRAKAAGLAAAAQAALDTSPELAALLARPALKLNESVETRAAAIAAIRHARAIAVLRFPDVGDAPDPRDRARHRAWASEPIHYRVGLPEWSGDEKYLVARLRGFHDDRYVAGAWITTRDGSKRWRIHGLAPHDPVVAARWSPHVVFLPERGNPLRIWDGDSQRLLEVPYPHDITSAEFAPAGDRFVTTASNGPVQISSVAGEELSSIDATAAQGASWWSGRDELLVVSAVGRVSVWDTAGHQLADVSPPDWSADEAWATEYDVVWAVSRKPGVVRVRRWRRTSVTAFEELSSGATKLGRIVSLERVSEEAPRHAALVVKAPAEASASSSGRGERDEQRVHVLSSDGTSTELRLPYERVHVSTVRWGIPVLVVSSEDTAYIWDMQANTDQVRTITMLGNDFWPSRRPGEIAALLHPGSGWDPSDAPCSTIRIAMVHSGATLLELAGHEGPVTFVAWSPTDRYLASVSEDDSVRVWDLEWRDLHKDDWAEREHPRDELLRLLDERCIRDFTYEERERFAELLRED